MSKKIKWILSILGILLLINGFGNIADDASVRCYDLTSIFTGIGFIVISKTNKC